MITTMPQTTRGTITTAWSKSLTIWPTLFFMLTTSTFQRVSRRICYSFQPWLFLPYSLVFLKSLFFGIGISFVFHWYFLTPYSLVFLNSWPRPTPDSLFSWQGPSWRSAGRSLQFKTFRQTRNWWGEILNKKLLLHQKKIEENCFET